MTEMSAENLEIITGTYEEFLLGYQVQKTKNEELNLVQSFANHSHLGSIRCVATSGRYLASGAADETIRLYDLVERKETGVLMHHSGTVTALEFSPNGSHLITCSEDGSIAVCRTGNWQVEKVWGSDPKGSSHKGSGVTCLSIHPSGKLALSVGTDATLRTWNLVKGRQAYATNLGKPSLGRLITSVLWSPCGNRYLILTASKLDIYSVATAGVESSIQPDKRICSAHFLNPTLLCLGTEDGYLLLYRLESGNTISVNQISGHDTRVKALHSIVIDESIWLASGSSGGEIKLWKLQGEDLVNVCSITTGCRITCLSVLDPKIRLRSAAVEETKLVQMEEKNRNEKMSDMQNSTNKKALIQTGEVITEVEKNKMKKRKKKRKNKSVNNTDESSIKCNKVCNDVENPSADPVKHTANVPKKMKIQHPVTCSKLERNKNIKLLKKNKRKYSAVGTRASGQWCVESA